MGQIVFVPHFLRQLKPLLKKFPDLRDSVANNLDTFNPGEHTQVTERTYKIRLSTKSLRRGKSGAFRLFVLVTELEGNLVPITIYFKSEKENLTVQELKYHTQIILSELQQM